MAESVPAPDSTTTWWPAAISFLTVSGEVATRVSCGAVSRITAINISFSSLSFNKFWLGYASFFARRLIYTSVYVE